ncbi:MAG: crotonase/enoyl-CoA hydratase family protein [Hyphomonadaceae bacterium]|jgi:enoyl-CoA hydratase/carnithine racemase|nr:crotonase/enoyl-CoA hydratase family protein [Hyphomonadaceae bacterium]
MTTAYPDGRITTERIDRMFLIGIDRPRKRNGFSPKMLTEMAEAYTAFERDDEAWVGLLFAEGPHFTAGLELDKVAPVMRERGSVYPAGLVDPLSLRPPIRTKPLVCAVQGICFTLGIELMLAADIVVAADDCRFAQIEVKRGIMPAGGATVRMVERAGWGNAQRYLLTGDAFGAAEALRLGFVQEVVAAGSQKQRALDMARTVAEQAPLAVRASLLSSRLSLDHGPQAAVREFNAQQSRLMATDDASEGVRSFVERRTGRFTGR